MRHEPMSWFDKSPEHFDITQQFPHLTGTTLQPVGKWAREPFDRGDVFVNRKGAPFASWFTALQYGTPVMLKNLLIAGQNNVTKAVASSPNDSHKNNVHAIRDTPGNDNWEVVTLYLSTLPLDRSDEYSNDHCVVLDSQDTLREFFPRPFRDCTFRLLCSGLVNINTATYDELIQSKLISEAVAAKICARRQELGGFKEVSQITEFGLDAERVGF